MSRSAWKPPFVHPQVLDTLPHSKNFIVQNRASLITPSIVGFTFKIYNGIRTFALTVGIDQVGQKRGQYAPTRKRPINKKIVKKVIKKPVKANKKLLNGTKNKSFWTARRYSPKMALILI